MGINPCPYKKKGQQMRINPCTYNKGQQMGINPCPYTIKGNKRESTHVHTQRRTTNGNQPMSIHNEGRQMGINPCPPSSFYWKHAAIK
jgi:hypothetical protein